MQTTNCNSFGSSDQFPGPTIEVRAGDTVEVEIINHYHQGIAIHWHGLYMRGERLLCF